MNISTALNNVIALTARELAMKVAQGSVVNVNGVDFEYVSHKTSPAWQGLWENDRDCFLGPLTTRVGSMRDLIKSIEREIRNEIA